MFFFVIFTSVLVFSVHVQDFSFHIRDSFVELFVPIFPFFFHFSFISCIITMDEFIPWI